MCYCVDKGGSTWLPVAGLCCIDRHGCRGQDCVALTGVNQHGCRGQREAVRPMFDRGSNGTQGAWSTLLDQCGPGGLDEATESGHFGAG